MSDGEKKLADIKKVAAGILDDIEQPKPIDGVNRELMEAFAKAMAPQKEFLRRVITSRPPPEVMKFLEVEIK